jgi:predicted nucleic acid-binding protein
MPFVGYVMPNNPKKPQRFYWDACVFLSIVEGHPDRMPVIEGLLSEAELGSIEIYTSTISIVEVWYGKAEKDGKALSSKIEGKINKLWLSTSPFRLIDLYPTIAVEAKVLMRQAMVKGLSLKTVDAIHLATAKQFKVTEFHTYDDGLKKYAISIGFKILEPHSNQFPFVYDDKEAPIPPPSPKQGHGKK